MKRYVLCSLFLLSLALFLVSCSDQSNSTTKVTPPPTPTPIVVQKGAVLSIPTVASYYQAIKAHNYERAFTYLSADAKTDSGQALTKDAFIQMATGADSENGSVTNVEIDPASPDSTQVILTIDRSSSLHYHAHLTLKKDGIHWKIVSLDRI
ncbi:hypothetical protein [Dictyobacter kobayashii]|uniref:DUF4878 domain-containing protein n=1 Tax=Dictyobacter kobayashii TaxID=2014872 RepID=A0A402AID8_9CHLR|nr:hypothetical protein [Dictyobacter kobayashii]GCE18891.1 hypothetical protein KDK_26910 [Dictyobacter kobayashii]